MDSNEINPVEVFAGKGWEAAHVQSLLENAEIQTFLKLNGSPPHGSEITSIANRHKKESQQAFVSY